MRHHRPHRYLLSLSSVLLVLVPALLIPATPARATQFCEGGGNAQHIPYTNPYAFDIILRITRVKKISGFESHPDFKATATFFCYWPQSNHTVDNDSDITPNWELKASVWSGYASSFPVRLKIVDKDSGVLGDGDEHADINPATHAYQDPGRDPKDLDLRFVLWGKPGDYQIGAVQEVNTGVQLALTARRSAQGPGWTTGAYTFGAGCCNDNRAQVAVEFIVIPR